MAHNHLEQLVAEWYEYRGYFVRRNVLVAKRDKGGYDCELDIVAFQPEVKRLVHIEPSMDALSWTKREERFRRKFALGREHIPTLFAGLELPGRIDQIALLCFASKARHESIGGGRIMLVSDLLREIIAKLKSSRVASKAVPEQFLLLRTLQFVCEYRDSVIDALREDRED